MGLIDIAGSLLGGGSKESGLLEAVLGLVTENGGLQGLIGRLQSSGLAAQAGSWVGTGENLPVSPDQIRSFLGGSRLQALASRLGMDNDAAANGLADLLPRAVDRMTPEGRLPEGSPDLAGMLKGLLG